MKNEKFRKAGFQNQPHTKSLEMPIPIAFIAVVNVFL
jgi:hypothetical protein